MTPPTLISLAPGQAHVWYAWTERCCTPERLALYRSLLNRDELQRLERLRFDYLKHEYLLTRALCRFSLSRYADVSPSAWRFATNEFGRPHRVAPDVAPSLHFNLANARSLVACVVSGNVETGVDVEQTHRDIEIADIAARHFSAFERNALLALPGSRQRQRFFELWTLKESYIKARSKGLAIPLDQFSFDLESAPPIRVAFDAALDDVANRWHFELFAPGDHHLMAVSLRRDGEGGDIDLRMIETIPGGDVA